MGNRARELLDKGKSVIFAFEEAIGRNTHTHTHTLMSYRIITEIRLFCIGSL